MNKSDFTHVGKLNGKEIWENPNLPLEIAGSKSKINYLYTDKGDLIVSPEMAAEIRGIIKPL